MKKYVFGLIITTGLVLSTATQQGHAGVALPIISGINGYWMCKVIVTSDDDSYNGVMECPDLFVGNTTKFINQNPGVNKTFVLDQFVGCSIFNPEIEHNGNLTFVNGSQSNTTVWELASPPVCLPPPTPIVIDMDQDGIEFGTAGVYTWFNYWDEQNPMLTQWSHPGEDEFFLALDLNGNGSIDSGKELFGNTTWLISEHTWADHGYDALAQYDDPAHGGNNDGHISAQDAIWQDLLLWDDADANAVSAPSELYPINASKIVALRHDAKASDYIDSAGNHWAWISHAKGKKGRHMTIDVIFALF